MKGTQARHEFEIIKRYQGVTRNLLFPLRGRVGEGGGGIGSPRVDPHPDPSPQGGGEKKEVAASIFNYALNEQLKFRCPRCTIVP
jgi:hypothetical protein